MHSELYRKYYFDVSLLKNIWSEPENTFSIFFRAYGLNGLFSESHWTPPSCIVTTPAPTTTLAPDDTTTTAEAGVVSTTESLAEKMDLIQAENDRLQAKIDGLKQEYEKIGLQVFVAFKENFFQSLEEFIISRKGGDQGISLASDGNSTEPMFG